MTLQELALAIGIIGGLLGIIGYFGKVIITPIQKITETLATHAEVLARVDRNQSTLFERMRELDKLSGEHRRNHP